MSETSLSSRPISDGQQGSSYVEWSAILAGAMLASAIIVVMTAFGSAIGLSLILPFHGRSPVLFYVVLALWFTWITVSSFITGGYLTGRLRRPIEGATPHEVHVRDGAHGLIVWAVAVVIGTPFATFSLSSPVTTLSLCSAIKGSVDLGTLDTSTVASSVGLNTDQIGYELDALLREERKGMADQNETTRDIPTVEPSRGDASRGFVTGAARGGLSIDERIDLVRTITAQGRIPPTDAEKRVDSILAQVKSAMDKVREATGEARRAEIVLGLSVATNAASTDSEVNRMSQQAEVISPIKEAVVAASRQEILRILSTGVIKGSLSSDDQAYLVRLVSLRANLAIKDTEKRIDVLFEQMRKTTHNVRAGAEAARKGGILLAFFTAATMVLGAAAA